MFSGWSEDLSDDEIAQEIVEYADSENSFVANVIDQNAMGRYNAATAMALILATRTKAKLNICEPDRFFRDTSFALYNSHRIKFDGESLSMLAEIAGTVDSVSISASGDFTVSVQCSVRGIIAPPNKY